MKFKWHLSLLAIVFSVLITGCTTTSTSIPIHKVSDADKIQARITELLQQAERSSPAESANLKAEAAQLLLNSNEKERAFSILASVQLTLLPEPLRFNIATLQAKHVLEKNNPEQAFNSLEQIKPNSQTAPHTEEQAALYLQLLAETYQQLGNFLAEVKTLIKLSLLNTEEIQRQQIHDQIWQQFRHINLETLSQNIRNSSLNYHEQGWLELAYELASHKQLDTQHQAFSNWSALWESHPAKTLPPSSLGGLTQKTFSARKIAVLLPFTGKLAKPANAIKEGILQAHLRQSGSGSAPEILFLNSEKINSPIQLAAIIDEESVDFVIGPLNKNFVAALAADKHLSTPILALNYAAEQGRDGLYQFGLSAEDEAKQNAELIWKEGKRTVATLTPQTHWGSKIHNAFTEHFTALGGRVVASSEYIDGSEFAEKISNLLNTDLSTQRYKQIRGLLSARKMEFEEHRRTDIDSIFITALPNEARQIKPILSFNFAGNLPVYSTSHVYSGKIDPIQDQDLNNIRFCDTPWSLNPPSQDKILLAQLRHNTNSRFGKLYALGLDAYRIFPYLNQLDSLPGTEIQGETGTLSIEHNGVIQRTLLWASFKDGTPQLIE